MTLKNAGPLMIAIILYLVLMLAAQLVVTARPYGLYSGNDSANGGVAWEYGGVELRGDVGPFVCEYANGSHNPLATLLPGLTVDC